MTAVSVLHCLFFRAIGNGPVYRECTGYIGNGPPLTSAGSLPPASPIVRPRRLAPRPPGHLPLPLCPISQQNRHFPRPDGGEQGIRERQLQHPVLREAADLRRTEIDTS